MSIQADPKEYVGKTMILLGGLKVTNHYNYSYRDAEDTHYSLDFGEWGEDTASPTGKSAYVYLPRKVGAGIIAALVETSRKGPAGYHKSARVKVTLRPEFYAQDKQWNMLEVHDVQWIEKDFKRWQPWLVAPGQQTLPAAPSFNAEKSEDRQRRMAEQALEKGNSAFKKKDFDQAIADYSEVIRIDPKHALAYGSRGYTYGMKGDLDNAIADFTEAIRLDPKDALAYYSRGRTYEQKGKRAEANADFAKAEKLGYSPKSRSPSSNR